MAGLILKSLETLPELPPSPAPEISLPVPEPIRIRSFRRERERVDGGDIKWKPIDRVAARVIAPATDIHKYMPLKVEKYMKLTPSLDEETQKRVNSILEEGEKDLARDIDLCHHMIKIAEHQPEQLLDLAQRTKEARRVLESSVDHIRSTIIEVSKEIPEAIAKMRSLRMTLTTEKELTVRALEDLRKFFLDKDHEKEMERLTEFVRTCERLAVLAKDGTLEKVADVMLKLA